jgi:clan AA aspartic protease
MISGEVNAFREVIVPLIVSGSGTSRQIEAAIDTGFNDELTLPPEFIRELGLSHAAPATATLAGGQIVEVDYFRAAIMWHGHLRETMVLELAGAPLVGMGLLDGSRLSIDAIPGGNVCIEEMT